MKISDTISEALHVYRSRIGKDSATVFTGNALGAALGFAASVMITRTLGTGELVRAMSGTGIHLVIIGKPIPSQTAYHQKSKLKPVRISIS
jgi:hypothetical protein